MFKGGISEGAERMHGDNMLRLQIDIPTRWQAVDKHLSISTQLHNYSLQRDPHVLPGPGAGRRQ